MNPIDEIPDEFPNTEKPETNQDMLDVGGGLDNTSGELIVYETTPDDDDFTTPTTGPGTRAWLEAAQIILANETSVITLRAALMQEIEENPIKVLKDIVIPMERLRVQQEKNRAMHNLEQALGYDSVLVENSVPLVNPTKTPDEDTQ